MIRFCGLSGVVLAATAIADALPDTTMAGDHAFVRASDTGGKLTADFVAVGKDGLVPPM